MRASGGQRPALRARPFRRRALSDSSRAGRPLTSELELVLWLEAQDLLHLRHGPPRRGRRRGRGAAAWAAGLRGGGRGRGARRAHGTHARTHARPDARTHVSTQAAAAQLRQRPEDPAAKGRLCACAWFSGALRRHSPDSGGRSFGSRGRGLAQLGRRGSLQLDCLVRACRENCFQVLYLIIIINKNKLPLSSRTCGARLY